MARREPLAVWLHGEHVATLEEKRDALRLGYTRAALRSYELNTPLVSVAMPVSAQPYGHKIAWPYFDGLLPEGDARRMLAFDFGIAVDDTFGLLAELGRDCAGALVIQPVTAPPPREPTEADGATLSEEDVARRLDQLRTMPLGVDGRVRVSLAGWQGKLLLSKRADGTWALPAEGRPSTHILKPGGALPQMVENEAFSLAVARQVGMSAAQASVAEFSGRRVLVVERFDRERSVDGQIERVHQEDFCQALSKPTERKYEENGGPAFERVASTLRRWRAPSGDLERLLQVAVVSVVLGNADLHGKNIALLHNKTGGITLAPLYDPMSTRIYPSVSRTMGMFVNGVGDIDAVGVGDLVAEGTKCGLGQQRAREVVLQMVERFRAAVSQAVDEVPEVPEELVAMVTRRAKAALDAAATVRHTADRRGGGIARSS